MIWELNLPGSAAELYGMHCGQRMSIGIQWPVAWRCLTGGGSLPHAMSLNLYMFLRPRQGSAIKLLINTM